MKKGGGNAARPQKFSATHLLADYTTNVHGTDRPLRFYFFLLLLLDVCEEEEEEELEEVTSFFFFFLYHFVVVWIDFWLHSAIRNPRTEGGGGENVVVVVAAAGWGTPGRRNGVRSVSRRPVPGNPRVDP